jgi:hypothetical protein
MMIPLHHVNADVAPLVTVRQQPEGLEIRCYPGWEDHDFSKVLNAFPLGNDWDYGITDSGVEVFSSFRRVSSPTDH